jgi:protein-S-isoprenylcysteine O-methyltransferase Ste14
VRVPFVRNLRMRACPCVRVWACLRVRTCLARACVVIVFIVVVVVIVVIVVVVIVDVVVAGGERWSAFFLIFTSLMLLEKRLDAKFSGCSAYEEYKARTSVLVPWPLLRRR